MTAQLVHTLDRMVGNRFLRGKNLTFAEGVIAASAADPRRELSERETAWARRLVKEWQAVVQTEGGE